MSSEQHYDGGGRGKGDAEDPIEIDSSNSGHLADIMRNHDISQQVLPNALGPFITDGSVTSTHGKKRKAEDATTIKNDQLLHSHRLNGANRLPVDSFGVPLARDSQLDRPYYLPVSQEQKSRDTLLKSMNKSSTRLLLPKRDRDSFQGRSSNLRPDDMRTPTVLQGISSETDDSLPYTTVLSRSPYPIIPMDSQKFAKARQKAEQPSSRSLVNVLPDVSMRGSREMAMPPPRVDSGYGNMSAFASTSSQALPPLLSTAPLAPFSASLSQHQSQSSRKQPRDFAVNQATPASGYDRVIFHPKAGYPLLPPGHPNSPESSRPFVPSNAPRPSLPVWTAVSPKDRKYEARLQSNDVRTPLTTDSANTVPVWALKRRGLTSALEYYRDPIATNGGSVSIGEGGVARSIFLEGSLGDGYGFWGTGKSVGTFVVPFGNARRRGRFQRRSNANSSLGSELGRSGTPEETTIAKPVDVIPPPRRPTPPPEVVAAIHQVLANSERADGKGPTSPTSDRKQEVPEIEALLRAHRARTPVAVGISEDCILVPFSVPRPFLILGWFWITDAWPEPTGEAWSNLEISCQDLQSPDVQIRWRFRFDWCTSGQSEYPWWEAPIRGVTPLFMSMKHSPLEDHASAIDDSEVSLTESVQLPKKNEHGAVVIERDEDRLADGWKTCIFCGSRSAEVYNGKHYCLNIECHQWFYDSTTDKDNKTPRRIILRAPRRAQRHTSEELGMHLRPPVFSEPADVQSTDAGKTYWRGWVCAECGCANERKHWRGWDCEGCSNKWYPDRKIWSASELMPAGGRDPDFNTSPCLDEIVQFVRGTTRTSTIWRDGTKACSYGLPSGNEVHHLLASPTSTSVSKTNDILQLLQAKEHVNFRRTPDQQPATRSMEKCYSPLYTFLAGPLETPMLEGLPSYKPVSWQIAPRVCVQAIGRINDISTRIISNEKRFNSLLFVCPPPDLPSILIPWIRVPQYSTFAIMYLGSRGVIHLIDPEETRKDDKHLQGRVEVQHGDIILIRSFETEVDLGLKPEGFGFFCVARQIYPPEDPAREGTGQSFTTCKRKKPPIMPREWPANAFSTSTVSEPISDVKPQDLPVERQGWHMGNIYIWNSGGNSEVEQPTAVKPTSA
ncbi:hypothetical protein QFC19_002290 [Naganishia cerealis]|uniref:Uncharacterized protein n=1 Tax=Naganishia cerealis TaxID=610337 RepID=A0ACC2WBG8_9TREE|nr:hypothetical protein QFC19_002290 [Naganishia cerealis]